ncbi:hypothetical protein V2J09_019359 [Rumex salicifolius]
MMLDVQMMVLKTGRIHLSQFGPILANLFHMQKETHIQKLEMYEQANGDVQCFGTDSLIPDSCGNEHEHDEDGFPHGILTHSNGFMSPMLFEDVSQTVDQHHHNTMEIEDHQPQQKPHVEAHHHLGALSENQHLVQQETDTNWMVPPHGHDQEVNHVNNILNLLNLPRCSSSILNTGNYQSAMGYLGVDLQTALDHQALPGSNASSTYEATMTTTCDPQIFHFNLPPQQPPPLFRDLVFQSPLSSCGGSVLQLAGNISPLFVDSRIGTDDGGEISHAAHQESEVLEFSKDPLEAYMARGEKEARGPKNFVSERQRRITMKDKYKQLRSLIPHPNKDDRASIVQDAIDHIHELNRRVNELKILVEKKRFVKQRCKRYKSSVNEDETAATNGVSENVNIDGKTELVDESFDNIGSLRSSWLHRKCKDTDIDVRIIDDEVTIKLVQRKKLINCLVYVSRALDELALDLHHVAGGHVGDYYSFLFNSKISTGSSIYTGMIANKLIEVLEKEYANIPPTSCSFAKL